MAFRIPNQGQVANDLATADLYDQAELDSVDIDTLVAGIGGRGVVSGCEVTAQAEPDMTVAVAAGTVRIGGVELEVVADDLELSEADEHPRFDLIVAEDDGSLAVVEGMAVASASGGPVFPTVAEDQVLLAAVYIPAGTTAITADHIVDKRVMVQRVVTGDGSITGIVMLTESEYGALDPPDPSTFYVVVEDE